MQDAPVTPDPTPQAQVERIQRMLDGFAGVYVLNVGLKLGLFARLAEAPGATAAELAGALGLHRRYVAVWCDVAHALKLLDASDDRRFALGPYYDLLLGATDGPFELKSTVDFYVDVLGEDFRRFPEAFRTGDVHRYQERGPAFSHHIGVLTGPAQDAFVRDALPRLPDVDGRLRAGAALIDIGCGTGRLICRLAEEYPHARFLGVDIDAHGVALARERLAGAGFGGRVAVEERGGEALEHDGEFDFAVLFQALHELEDTVRPRVIAACRRALRPDGALVIVDHTYPETVAELRDSAYRMAVNFEWFELLWGNRTQTRSEVDAMLAGAGFRDVAYLPFPETGFHIIVARPS